MSTNFYGMVKINEEYLKDIGETIADLESQLTEAAEILDDLIDILGGRNCDCSGYGPCPVCRAVKFLDENFENGWDCDEG